jgi:colanic acid/amylovoran biosynthesis glycosyltransferase
MKIAFLVEKFPALSETFILNQAVGLIENGHQVDIYARQTNDTFKIHPDVEKYNLLQHTYYAPSFPDNYIWRILKAFVLLIINLKKAPLVIMRSLNFSKYKKRAISLQLLYFTIPFLNLKKYDIIHCQFGMYGIEGMILREIGAIEGKLITSFRGYDISWYVKEHGDNVYQALFANGDFFLTNCNFFRNRAIKLGCNVNKIIVHGSGINCDRFIFNPRYLKPNQKIQITTTGRLIEKKGIEYGIRAVAKVAAKYPNIQYRIIGAGDLQSQLQKLIYELKMTDKIHLLGWKNQQEIIQIINDSHIFIAPSVTAKDGNQDAPLNTLKEAMAMGLPVIATQHGGIPELVQDGISGFLVPERDSSAIANKLIYLIEHPNTWEKIGKAGSTYVEKNYNIKTLNNELIKIYQNILTPNPQSNKITPILLFLRVLCVLCGSSLFLIYS